MNVELNRETAFDHLNKVIEIQANLAGANFDVNQFMNLVVEQMQQLTPATGVVVELVEDHEMVYRAATGSVKEYIGLRLLRENSISGLCVKTKEVLLSNDTEVDDRVNAEACRKVGARSLVVAPLFHEGKAIGVLKILSREPNAFSEQDVQTLKLMAGLIGSALAKQIYHENTQHLLDERTRALEELKKAEEKLKHMANYDYLTDLPNRALLIHLLNSVFPRLKRNKQLHALFFLDIDHFKKINDTLGHAVGDELLKAFSSRIVQSIRSSDVAARLGGDEFVILLNEIPGKELAIEIANKIIAKMKTPFVLNGEKLSITTSIGITYFDTENKTADLLLKEADDALYDAKKAGKNRYIVYEKKPY